MRATDTKLSVGISLDTLLQIDCCPLQNSLADRRRRPDNDQWLKSVAYEELRVIVCSIDSTTYRMCTTVTYRLDLMSIQYRYLALRLQLTTTLYFSFCSTSAHSSVQAQHPPHRPNIILFFLELRLS